MADIIELAEGVAAEIGDGADVMFAPEFDLKGIKEKRIVVVPAGIETKPNARDYLEDRLKVQVGILKKCTEDDVPALIREVTATGRRFLHKWVAGLRCVKAECNPLYSPEHLRDRRQSEAAAAEKKEREKNFREDHLCR